MSTLLDDLNAEVRNASERLSRLIPAEAVRYGWNLRNLSVNIGEPPPDGVIWRVEAIGPNDVMTEVHRYATSEGLREARSLRVIPGLHGVLEASTVDELERMVREWIRIVWPK